MITVPVRLVEVAAAGPVWAERLTAAERAYCTGLHHAAEHLAARAAAKQAVLAALDLPDPVSWQDVEIRREPHHAPVVVLHGALDAARAAAGLPTPRVSLTHAAGRAAALALLPAVLAVPAVPVVGARPCG